jgi:HSP20 family protein
VNRLFDDFFGHRMTRGDVNGASFAPPVDVEETADAFVIRADLPGIDQKDIQVHLTGDVLTIRGQRTREEKTQSGSLHRTERVHGTFERTFTLGSPVRNDAVSAAYKNGVLEIHVPKAEQAKVREIEVKVG